MGDDSCKPLGQHSGAFWLQLLQRIIRQKDQCDSSVYTLMMLVMHQRITIVGLIGRL